MHHPHADEMVQMAMGMMGFWITHPKDKHPLIDGGRPRLLLPAQRLRHRSGQLRRKVNTMLDFNLWSWNSRVPGIDPLVVSHMDKVRIRIGNLTMTNHPSTCTGTSSWSPARRRADARARAGTR